MKNTKYAKVCDECGKGINSGIYDFGVHLCSEKCYIKNNSNDHFQYIEDLEIAMKKHPDVIYYTDYEDEDEYEYVKIGEAIELIEDLDKIVYTTQIVVDNAVVPIIAEPYYEGSFDHENSIVMNFRIIPINLYGEKFQAKVNRFIAQNKIKLVEEIAKKGTKVYLTTIVL